MRHDDVRQFFDRYERVFELALAGELEMKEVAELYAAEFIAASPAGVATGKNDDAFKEKMAQGYERYRAIGTKTMRVRAVRISPVDELHCVAHVAWIATYARQGERSIEIDFEVHYLVQELAQQIKVFGWISGDEEAALKAHGVL